MGRHERRRSEAKAAKDAKRAKQRADEALKVIRAMPDMQLPPMRANPQLAPADWLRTQLGLAIRDLEARFVDADLVVLIGDRQPTGAAAPVVHAINCSEERALDMATEYLLSRIDGEAPEPATAEELAAGTGTRVVAIDDDGNVSVTVLGKGEGDHG